LLINIDLYIDDLSLNQVSSDLPNVQVQKPLLRPSESAIGGEGGNGFCTLVGDNL